jgi:hypothetical protein
VHTSASKAITPIPLEEKAFITPWAIKKGTA